MVSWCDLASLRHSMLHSNFGDPDRKATRIQDQPYLIGKTAATAPCRLQGARRYTALV